MIKNVQLQNAVFKGQSILLMFIYRFPKSSIEFLDSVPQLSLKITMVQMMQWKWQNTVKRCFFSGPCNINCCVCINGFNFQQNLFLPMSFFPLLSNLKFLSSYKFCSAIFISMYLKCRVTERQWDLLSDISPPKWL